MEALSDSEVKDRLIKLDGWAVRNGVLKKVFVFGDFKKTFSFMSKLADVAEELDHHPDWSNTYNRLTIRLSTHEAGGLTDKDFEFAKRADSLAGRL